MPAYRCADASDQRTEPMLATASQVRGWARRGARAWGGARSIAAARRACPRRLEGPAQAAPCARGVHPLAPSRPSARRSALRVRRSPTRPRDAAVAARRGSLADVVGAMDDLRLHRDEATGWRHAEHGVILVCTNGRHDQCCANRGRPVIRALGETVGRSSVGVLTHRRRPLRGQRRRAAGQHLLRARRAGLGGPAVGGARRRSDRSRPFPWAHVAVARRAGGRALRASRARGRRARCCSVAGRMDDGAFEVRVGERTARVGSAPHGVGGGAAHVSRPAGAARAELHARIDQ